MPAKILVVDDDPTMLKMVEGHLQSAGYIVKSATDGSMGLRLAADWSPELILMDVMMPVMDGFTTTKRIREFSATPIIILTAKGDEHDLVRGLDAGADDYVVKPFSSQELLARVRAVLRRSETQGLEDYHHKIFRHGDLVIDVDRASVVVRGEEINVTATEFRLLVSLAGSMGEVLTREELLASVWGPDYRNEKTILWVTLSRLRQKIELDPKNPVHIVTRQGIGYAMPSLSDGVSEG
ncbi:MAG: response regulator transcription factor [Anaerolineales bacterium]|nr:response regulator transcription factor [Anaerolineales bacterium]